MSTEPGKTRYRFRVRGPDGKETVSETFALDTRNPSGAKNMVNIHLKVEDDDGHPHVSRPFEIKVGGTTIKGTTSAKGVIDVKVPKGKEADLTIHGNGGRQHFVLAMGGLAPPTEVLGAQERLQSMGFSCKPTGTLDEETQHAILAFQKQHGLPAKGALDANTSKRIDESYRAAH